MKDPTMNLQQKAELKRQHKAAIDSIGDLTDKVAEATAQVEHAEQHYDRVNRDPGLAVSRAHNPAATEAREALSRCYANLESLEGQLDDAIAERDRLQRYLDASETYGKARAARDALQGDLSEAQAKLHSYLEGLRKLEADHRTALQDLSAAQSAIADRLLAEALGTDVPTPAGDATTLELHARNLQCSVDRATALVEQQHAAVQALQERLAAAQGAMDIAAAMDAEVEAQAALADYLPKLARYAAARRKAYGWGSFTAPDLEWALRQHLEASPVAVEEPEALTEG